VCAPMCVCVCVYVCVCVCVWVCATHTYTHTFEIKVGWLNLLIQHYVCMFVCVCVRERDRERVRECTHAPDKAMKISIFQNLLFCQFKEILKLIFGLPLKKCCIFSFVTQRIPTRLLKCTWTRTHEYKHLFDVATQSCFKYVWRMCIYTNEYPNLPQDSRNIYMFTFQPKQKTGTHAHRASKLGPVERLWTQDGKLGITIQEPPRVRKTERFIVIYLFVLYYVTCQKSCHSTSLWTSVAVSTLILHVTSSQFCKYICRYWPLW